MEVTVETAVLVGTTLLGTATSLWLGFGTRKRDLADSDKIATERKQLEDDITQNVLDRANVALMSMQRQINDERREKRSLRKWVEMLCVQVIGLGGIPCGEPESEAANE